MALLGNAGRRSQLQPQLLREQFPLFPGGADRHLPCLIPMLAELGAAELDVQSST
jgi:hypothetical protein